MKRDGSEDFLYMLMPARLSTQDAMTAEELGDFGADSQRQIESSENEQAPEPEQEDNNGSESDTPF